MADFLVDQDDGQIIVITQIDLHTDQAHSIGIESQIETARGFVNLNEIGGGSARLEALSYGPGDYAASMQMPLANIGEADQHDAAYPGHRWHAVMHGIVAAARANDLRCMDGPYADFRDTEGLQAACQAAR